MIIDFDKLGADEVKQEIENTNYANDCIYPRVMKVETVDIGEWEDSHPLNKKDCKEAFNKLFDGSEASNSSPEGSGNEKGQDSGTGGSCFTGSTIEDFFGGKT